MHDSNKKTSLFTFVSSDWVLGILVVFLSVVTALAAYQSSIFDSKEADFNVEGQKLLTDSNSLYLEANQFVIYDYTMYDGWYINEGRDDELAQYYLDSFSEYLTASLDREEGPFDDQYYEEMYIDAETSYDEAMTSFEDAQVAGDKADKLQLVVLIMAVGLALAAYASILSNENRLRAILAICSIITAIISLVAYFSA